MDTKQAIKIMLANANLSSRDLYKDFNTSKAGSATKISKGIYSIKDLLVICKACNANLKIVLQNGIELPLDNNSNDKSDV